MKQCTDEMGEKYKTLKFMGGKNIDTEAERHLNREGRGRTREVSKEDSLYL